MSTTTTDLSDALKVLDGIEMRGTINTPDETLLANIKHSIRLGYPQVRPQAPQADRVCLVGGGPSLEETFDELRALYFAGAKVVTVNGSYQWCLDHNIRPSAHIVLDARAENARFVNPAIPQCRYLLASQCHPDTWAAVAGRDDVWIWHAIADDNPHRQALDDYYCGRWVGSPGGTTVVMRAITVLQMIGFRRFDLFGVDSCFMGTQHHAYPQAENDSDRPYPVRLFPTGRPDMGREFQCAPWHMKQLECFLQLIRLHGDTFLLNVHGDGLLAFALKVSASANVEVSLNAAAINGDRSGKV
jgi:hypothetical protein